MIGKEINTLEQYKYAAVLSNYNGKILLRRHRDGTIWETQGGHIEESETPLRLPDRNCTKNRGR